MTKRSRLRRAIADTPPLGVMAVTTVCAGIMTPILLMLWLDPWEFAKMIACAASFAAGLMVYHRAAKALVDWARRGDD